MVLISSSVAGLMTRLTRDEPAPRIFGGARKISSSSSAATRIARSTRYAAALLDSVSGSSAARHRLISESVTSTSGMSANHGRMRVLSKIR